MSANPENRTPRRRWIWPIIALAGVVLVGGGVALGYGLSRPGRPSSAPSAWPAPSNTYVGPASVVSDVQKACTLNAQMRSGQADLTGQGATIAQIQTLAGQSSNFDIRFDANMLKDRYDLAAAAQRTGGNTVATTLELTTASLRLSTDCIKAGYPG